LFSGLLFGLIAIESRKHIDSKTSFFGLIDIPNRVYPTFLILILQIFVPNVSFIGHVSGALSGYIISFNWPLVLNAAYLEWFERILPPSFSLPQTFIPYNPASVPFPPRPSINDLFNGITSIFRKGYMYSYAQNQSHSHITLNSGASGNV
jgi:hypothetical protein